MASKWAERLEYWGSEGPALVGTLVAVLAVLAFPIVLVVLVVHALLR